MRLDAEELLNVLAQLESITDAATGYGKLVSARVSFEITNFEGVGEDPAVVIVDWAPDKNRWVITEIQTEEP